MAQAYQGTTFYPIVRQQEPSLLPFQGDSETRSLERWLANLVKKMGIYAPLSKESKIVNLFGPNFEIQRFSIHGIEAWESIINRVRNVADDQVVDINVPNDIEHVYPMFYTRGTKWLEKGTYFAMVLPFIPNEAVRNYLRTQKGFQPNEIVVFRLPPGATMAIPYGTLDVKNEFTTELLKHIDEKKKSSKKA